MQESRVLGEEWREDFQAPVTFYSYGADEYELGGIKISGEDILDSALAEQELLLGEMGLSSEAYHITSMDWDGESFMDETGQVCRRASARGERLLRDYEAVYRGQVQVVEPVSYEVSAVYEPAELGNISNSEKGAGRGIGFRAGSGRRAGSIFTLDPNRSDCYGCIGSFRHIVGDCSVFYREKQA